MRGKGRGTSRQAVALARLAEKIPWAETMTFPKLGHFAPERTPDAIARSVLGFFADYPERLQQSASRTSPL
jgi:pimeloyl-ACP methyl ester carboxylesterase